MFYPLSIKLDQASRNWSALAASAVICVACSGPQDGAEVAEAPAPENVVETAALPAICATPEEAAQVQNFYSETRPGAVLPIPGRKLGMVEAKIASGLSAENAVGVDGTPERLAAIWETIDAWGEDTNVGLVVSIDGWHPFDFPSTVPVTQETHNKGFYDVYAVGEDGVHIHLNPDDVKLIYAAKLPAADDTATRTVSLYDSDGRLIVGVYASKAGKTNFDQAAIEGFEASWNLIESMPRACIREQDEG